jgi:3-oxoadipate enol-lactonase
MLATYNLYGGEGEGVPVYPPRPIETEVGVLHVEEYGDRAKASVLLWPSLYCVGSIWRDQIEALAPRHHLLVLDPPGHGRSGVPPRRFTLAATARATRTVVDAFAVDEVVIIGGAWGGMVGVELAASCPELVRGLVLINSPLDRWHGRQRVEVSLLTALLALGGPKAAASLLSRSMLSARTRRELRDRVVAFTAAVRALDRRSLHRSARSAMLDRPSLLPLLPGLDLPVLAIAGADDSLWPAARAMAEVGAISGARFEVVGDTAHLTAFETPDRVNAMLIEFLDAALDLDRGGDK